MGCKAAETTHNINNLFGPVRWQFRKFYKGDESHEDEERSNWPLEVDNDQQRAIVEADPLTTTQELAEELSIDSSIVIRHLKQIGKVKKVDKQAPHEQTEKKIIILKCHLPLFYVKIMNHFLMAL